MSIFREHRNTGRAQMSPAQKIQFEAFRQKGILARREKRKRIKKATKDFATGVGVGTIASLGTYAAWKLKGKVGGAVGAAGKAFVKSLKSKKVSKPVMKHIKKVKKAGKKRKTGMSMGTKTAIAATATGIGAGALGYKLSRKKKEPVQEY